MIFKHLSIPDVILITPKVFNDNRGFFVETYKQSIFKTKGINCSFKQDNHSKSQKGVFRGFHYQLNPKAQGKLVRVVKGAITDYAVDIRKGSSNYGKWVSAELNEDNKKILWIPPGFAHGFLSLKDNTEVIYKTTNEYAPEYEKGIKWDDPEINIILPFEPKLSVKDSSLPLLKDADNNFNFKK